MRDLDNRETQNFLEDEFAEHVNPILPKTTIRVPLHLFGIMYESLLLEPFPVVW
jgi:hypothetical protein